MGYAKLYYTDANTPGKAMQDIVNIVTGVYTNTANLVFANADLSEIVNDGTRGNWTLLYGTKANNTGDYVLTSNTVSNKTHYVWLRSSNGSAWGNLTSNTTFANNATGVGIVTISGATNSTSVSNPTHMGINAAANGQGSVVRVNATNNKIYLSWSSNHIMLYGMGYSGVTAAAQGIRIIGSFEYPENSLTQYMNSPAVVNFRSGYTAATSFIATSGESTGSATTSMVFQGINVYDPATDTKYGVYSLGSNTAMSGSLQHNLFVPVATLDATTGGTTYNMTPLYYLNVEKGQPHINISQFSEIYFLPQSIASPEDIFTVGSNNYVWLPLGNDLSGSTQDGAIAVLKK